MDYEFGPFCDDDKCFQATITKFFFPVSFLLPFVLLIYNYREHEEVALTWIWSILQWWQVFSSYNHNILLLYFLPCSIRHIILQLPGTLGRSTNMDLAQPVMMISVFMSQPQKFFFSISFLHPFVLWFYNSSPFLSFTHSSCCFTILLHFFPSSIRLVV